MVLAETLSKAPQGHPLKGMVVLRLNGLDLTQQVCYLRCVCSIVWEQR